MQWNTRIHIKVDDVKDWEKLKDFNFERYDIYVDESDFRSTSLVLDNMLSIPYPELRKLISELAGILKSSGQIIADCTCVSMDDNISYVYSLNRDGKISSGMLNEDMTPDIYDFKKWCKAFNIKMPRK